MDFCLNMCLPLSRCAGGGTEEEEEQRKRNKMIGTMIRQAKEEVRREQKILLLGAGECGKSTFLKQMRIIIGGGFKSDQVEYYQRVVHKNIHQSAATIASAMRTLGIPFSEEGLAEELEELVSSFSEKSPPELLPPHFFPLIKRLWSDPQAMECFDRRREFQLLDSAKYFLDRVSEVEQPDYLPSEQDIVRTRVKTTAVIEEMYPVGRINLRIIDVGGQRAERRKWISCFSDVTSVLFLASLSEYDMTLAEKQSQNRTVESLQLFKTIVGYPWFRQSSLILFLNKKDLFEEKIPKSNLADFFPEFTGTPGNIPEALDFMVLLFQGAFADSLTSTEERALFLHITCATDTDNIRRVFNNVKTTILQRNITELNLG